MSEFNLCPAIEALEEDYLILFERVYEKADIFTRELAGERHLEQAKVDFETLRNNTNCPRQLNIERRWTKLRKGFEKGTR